MPEIDKVEAKTIKYTPQLKICKDIYLSEEIPREEWERYTKKAAEQLEGEWEGEIEFFIDEYGQKDKQEQYHLAVLEGQLRWRPSNYPSSNLRTIWEPRKYRKEVPSSVRDVGNTFVEALEKELEEEKAEEQVSAEAQ